MRAKPRRHGRQQPHGERRRSRRLTARPNSDRDAVWRSRDESAPVSTTRSPGPGRLPDGDGPPRGPAPRSRQRVFLDAFPDFTAPDGDRVKRATFLYRHRLVRVRAEVARSRARPPRSPRAPRRRDRRGTVATLNDADVGAGGRRTSSRPSSSSPARGGCAEALQVGTASASWRGSSSAPAASSARWSATAAPVDRRRLPIRTWGLWFSPECLVVVETRRRRDAERGGMDGEPSERRRATSWSATPRVSRREGGRATA